jgi:hypothetical protein
VHEAEELDRNKMAKYTSSLSTTTLVVCGGRLSERNGKKREGEMEKTELSISFSLCPELKLWGLCEKETDGPRAIMIPLCVC